ncbi:hypothetical protein Ait01nite_073170 [Actinoplanes italicus]|uniref:Lipoprotein LprG n=1 Tax=Actinoplanes italicus TaxID=113567 RepID=A0A2T0K088_9ACTN|nr:hypothetical protein [Actinoplanes italicus]PRX16197.1 hypothetical protein CLV67_12011 [Actinoplanes italicus]GIE34272.1 hypothetical protein Ait01nite_073170 [Actinoplanes italicus]
MRNHRRVAGLATVTVLALGAAACGTAEAGTSQVPPSAADNLAAAVPDATTPAFSYTAKGGCMAQFSGMVDPATKTRQVESTMKTPHGTLTMSFKTVSSGTTYARITSKPASLFTRAGIPRDWMKLDPAKFDDPDNDMVSFDEDDLDPMGVGRLVGVASGVVQDGAKFTGTLDLTRYGKGSSAIAADTVTELGAQAQAIPFEAAVDEAGNVSTMTIKVPSAKACTITYRYGKVKKPSAPKAKKAPAAVYRMLNG